MDYRGERIGPYDVSALIGTGGFASVYLAEDERLRSNVALKVLADNHALDPAIRERFIDEGHVLRRIDSPHVVQVFDIGETADGRPYLVLTHADKGDLALRVADLHAEGWMATAADLTHVVDVLAEAMSAIHAERVVHRDIKPGNILIRSTARPRQGPGLTLLAADERLLVSDLGFAKDLSVGATSLTVGGGTSGFRAPEQDSELGVVDLRADLYSATALVAWLASAVVPTSDASWRDATDSRWGPRLTAAIDAGLADDPDARPGSAAEWRQLISEAITPTHTAPATSVRPATSSVDVDDPTSHRRPLMIIGAVVAMIALVGSGLLLALRDPHTATTPLGDGRVQAQAVDGDERVTVTGPDRLRVGRRADYEVETSDDVSSWAWTLPNGSSFVDEPSIFVMPESAGTAFIGLTAQTRSGDELRVKFRVEVSE